MKRKNIFIAFMLICTFAVAQDTLPQAADHLQNAITAGAALLDATHNTLIPGMENSTAGLLLYAILREVIPAIRRRRKRKKAEKAGQTL